MAGVQFDSLRPCQLVKCILRDPYPSSIPGQELKPTQNPRKELGVQVLGRASQHSSPVQPSGGLGQAAFLELWFNPSLSAEGASGHPSCSVSREHDSKPRGAAMVLPSIKNTEMLPCVCFAFCLKTAEKV